MYVWLSDHGTPWAPAWRMSVPSVAPSPDRRYEPCCNVGHSTVEEAVDHGCERLRTSVLEDFEHHAKTEGSHAYGLRNAGLA